MVRTAHFAGVLVLDIGRSLQRIGRTAHAALGRRGFSFRYGHWIAPLERSKARRTLWLRALHSGPWSESGRAYTRSSGIWPASGPIILLRRRCYSRQRT